MEPLQRRLNPAKLAGTKLCPNKSLLQELDEPKTVQRLLFGYSGIEGDLESVKEGIDGIANWATAQLNHKTIKNLTIKRNKATIQKGKSI